MSSKVNVISSTLMTVVESLTDDVTELRRSLAKLKSKIGSIAVR